MKKLFCICFFVIAHSTFAFDNYTQFAKRLDAYQQQLTKQSTIQDEKILSSFLPMINAYKTPYAKIHEHTDLFQWQLFQNCYFKYSTDTSSTVINLDVEYKPIDDFFSTIPAYFFIDTKRPHSSLADYKNFMITVFKSLGTGHSVIIDKEDKSYGFPGYHYCLSFNYSSTKMLIDCYFVYVDNVACAVYYMTGYSY